MTVNSAQARGKTSEIQKMSGKAFVRLALLGSALFLAACDEREVIFEGKRESLYSPDPELAGEAVAARFAEEEAAALENRSVPFGAGAARSLAAWPQRAGGSSHALGNLSFSSAPQLAYQVDIGVAADRKQKIVAEPIVAEGRVFTMDAQSGVMAHSTVGAPLWMRPLVPAGEQPDEGAGGGLAYANGKVFATTGFGEVTALDAVSGAPAWTQRLEASITGAPMVSGGDVYVLTGDNRLVSLDAGNGRINWQLEGTPARPGLLGYATPAMSGGTVIAPFSLGSVVGVKASDGSPVWAAPVAGRRTGNAFGLVQELSGEPVVVGGTIYAGNARGASAAISSTSGEVKWTADEGALGPMLVAGGSVFMVSDNLKLVRLNASNGSRIWAVDLPQYEKDTARQRKTAYQSYGPTLAGGRLWVASSDGFLRAYDPASGAIVSALELPAAPASRPVIVGGTAYIVTVEGTLLALR